MCFAPGRGNSRLQRLPRLLAIRPREQHVFLATTARRPFQLSQCRRWRAAEGKFYSVCGRCRSAKVGALLPAPCRAAAGSVAFKPYFAFPPAVTPNPSFKRTASPPLNSNVSPLNSPYPVQCAYGSHSCSRRTVPLVLFLARRVANSRPCCAPGRRGEILAYAGSNVGKLHWPVAKPAARSSSCGAGSHQGD